MKTIFITCYQGFISRNIFNTDVLKVLREQKDLKIILVVPTQKKEFILKYYGGDNVIVEGVDFEAAIEANKFWYRVAFFLQNTQYVKDQRKEHLWTHKTAGGYLSYYWLSFWALVLSKMPGVKTLYRKADFHWSPKNLCTHIFERYNPSLIFSTDIFGQPDIFLIREAKHKKIPVVGMVRSWDNTTTKGLLRIIPKKIIVHSPVVKKELIKFHGCNSEYIHITGLPQFDAWLSGPTVSREEFFKTIGADPNKKLLLFAPAGRILSDTDWQLCHILRGALHNGTLPSNIQFLVRNHPQHPADLSKFEGDSNFIIETPGLVVAAGDFKSAHLSPDENTHLQNSVYYSHIIMYVVTSLGLDASVYNKPQILINFDGWESKPYIQSVRRYHKEDCLYNLVKCGGTKVVYSTEEWIEAIQNYLNDPTRDQEGRNKAVQKHLYNIDGQAGKRIADCILDSLYHV